MSCVHLKPDNFSLIPGLKTSWRIGCLILCASQVGCLMTREKAFHRIAYVASFNPRSAVTVKANSKNRPLQRAGCYFAKKPKPSARTELLLRKYSLLDRYRSDPQKVIQWLQELAAEPVTMEEVHALAELAEIEANWLRGRGQVESASNYYATALVHSYQFLFAPRLDLNRNAYDPQFRNICDIYNRSLEGLLRQVCAAGKLSSGQSVIVGSGASQFEFAVEIAGRWQEQEFERFELVSDYQTTGLVNQYHTYGLGVPLIAVRKQQAIDSPVEKYYPPNLTLAMTAFCHLHPDTRNPETGLRRAVLTLYDPLERTTVTADSQVVPLESDITTPLAYNLRDPVISTGVLETASLLNAELAPELYGMYMLEPYNPAKIPVVMVHGLWSSPITWVQMFNDLRANPDIHANYQFWFYSYPSGQPFWNSARQMRDDLAKIRRVLDPSGDSASLDQLILVGHSMGGLVSAMQTMESDNRFWKMVSQDSIESFEGDPESLKLLRDTFYFSPNPSVRRVITIATPFQGSDFANEATRWISKKLFTLPQLQTDHLKKIAQLNSDKLSEQAMLTTATSLDSLASGAPVFTAINEADVADGVKFHNIFGKIPKNYLVSLGRPPVFLGDGVVSLESANHVRAVSQLAVPAEHSDVHQSPACIYEVKRILIENLVELDRIRSRHIPKLPADTVVAPNSPPIRPAPFRNILFRDSGPPIDQGPALSSGVLTEGVNSPDVPQN